MKNPIDNNIYIEDYYIVFIGSLNENKNHHHYAIQITISLNQCFTIHTKDLKKTVTEAVLINSNLSHRIECGPDAFQLVILLEPESGAGEYFQQQMQKEGDLIIAGLNQEKLMQYLHSNYSPDDVFHYILSQLGYKSTKDRDQNIDNRIKNVLDLVPKIYNKEIKVKEIADSVFLSESRFQHLFKEQMSVPFSKYLIWYKMKQAVRFILEEKKSYSFSALESGFTDYPYMCRTFNHFFGFRPNQILKNSRIFQELAFSPQ